MARYLADEHDHDLSGLSTYDDIRTAATDGSLRIDITEDNIYVLNGLADDIADGPDALDRDQLALAVEFIRDVGTYSEDDTIATLLAVETPIGRLVGHILDPESTSRPGPRTPRRSSSGSNWRRSWSHDCAASDHAVADVARLVRAPEALASRELVTPRWNNRIHVRLPRSGGVAFRTRYGCGGGDQRLGARGVCGGGPPAGGDRRVGRAALSGRRRRSGPGR